jgi:hypothetical protein
MSEEPVLLATSIGPMAGVLTLPDTPPVAAVYVLQGWACPRSDANQMWARLARALTNSGIATMRADYAGRGESWDADKHQRVTGAEEVARWFEARVGDVPWVVLAYCYGLSPAVTVCRGRDNILGVAVVNPPMTAAAVATRRKPSLRRRIDAATASLRLFPRWAAYRIRFGPAQTWHTEQAIVDHPTRELADLTRMAPTWIFASSNDASLGAVRSVLAGLEDTSTVELELNETVDMRDARTPEAQDALIAGVESYVHRCLSSTPAPT